MPTLGELSTDQQQAWAAVRARLTITHPWLTDGVFRAVPVALAGDTAPVCADRWGRIYVDFTLEQRSGIAALAAAVQEAVLTWLSGTTTALPWHASRLDERFPAVGGADTDRAARHAAAGMAAHAPSRFERDEFAPWREWATRLAGPPQVPWQDQLGGLLRGAFTARSGHLARTYTRPGRRQQPGVLTPALRGPALNVAVIADISGSIAADLPTVLAEVSRICDAAGVGQGHVTLFAVDDEVASTHRMPAPGLTLASRAGHRTDLRAGFAAASAAAHRPDVVVALTDGLTPWPPHPPACPVIVALIGPRTVTDNAAQTVPAWAGTVRIDTAGDQA